MLKKMSLRKIAVTSSALIIMGMLYFFPLNDKQIEFKYNIVYEEEGEEKIVYLLNSDYYVSMLNINLNSEKDLDLIKEKIEILTRGSSKSKDIPKGFSPLIPPNTKLLDVTLKEKVLTLNFSSDFLTIESEIEEKMIEAIIFSLTELDSVEKVKIEVDSKPLKNLPNSNKKLPEVFTRDFGINKKYEIASLTPTVKTTIFYNSYKDDETYYIPVTKITNETDEKITVIINELKSSAIAQESLGSYLSNEVFLENYEIKDNKMTLTFNEHIFDGLDTKKILEEVKYAISMSVLENYDVEEVIFSTKNEENLVSVIKTLE